VQSGRTPVNASCEVKVPWSAVKTEPSEVRVLMEMLQEDYQRFHSPLPRPKGVRTGKA
jgi:hypothetical protein